MESLDFVMQTVKHTRAAIKSHIPVIGFAGAPFTLASYMIEGGGSRNYINTKRLMYRSPAAWHELMTKLTRTIARYLNAQIQAGAQCVQSSILGSDVCRWRTTKPIFCHICVIFWIRLFEGAVINFGTGNPMLTSLYRGDSRTVVGLDWRIPLDQGWAAVGHDRAVQGNLDPTILFADLSTIKNQVYESPG